MANQNTGTPRFYIDKTSYLQLAGIAKADDNSWGYGLDVSNPRTVTGTGSTFYMDFRNYLDENGANVLHSESYNFLAVLGHNFKSTEESYVNMNLSWADETGNVGDAQEDGTGKSVNILSSYLEVDYDGFSIMSFDEFNEPHYLMYLRVGDIVSGAVIKIGRVAVGTYYDMPHSPELSLTMSHEYDGIKKQETAGGSTLNYVNYYKPPDWGDDLQAWQLDGWDRKYSGRRVWDLSWNYLSDSDIEPKHYNMDESHPDWNEDGNWFTNVLHYTNGGQLPFIFCPDPSIGYVDATRTIPEFAICRFDMKTFKREQVANGVYNIKVKIKESW